MIIPGGVKHLPSLTGTSMDIRWYFVHSSKYLSFSLV